MSLCESPTQLAPNASNDGQKFRDCLLVPPLGLSAPPSHAFGQTSARSVSWLEDFAQLKREMAAHYANLEWAVAERQIDLKQLSEQTESRLRQAPNDNEARGVIESFLRAFHDGHLVVDWPTQSPKSAEAKSAARPQFLSSRLGFHQDMVAPGIAFFSVGMLSRTWHRGFEVFCCRHLVPSGRQEGRFASYRDFLRVLLSGLV